MIAPVTGVPARPLAEGTDSKLNISVVFTSVELTLEALRQAGKLAISLGGSITLIFPQVVPYPLPLASPPVAVEFTERRLRVLAGGSPVETQVNIFLCRDAVEALLGVLKPNSLVVIGSRRKWWPTAEEKLAATLRSAGHQVVITKKG
jgi:hypothetical protein